MRDEDYLLRSFERNFMRENSHEATAIYGISRNTEIVLNAFQEFEICGIMDGFLKEGSIYGKRIISEEDALRLRVKRIIIIARAASVKIVFNRIRGFCEEHEIKVFDVNGADLFHKYQRNVCPKEKDWKSYEELLAEIDRHEVISFDIFDTILMRKILEPTDLFLIMDGKIQGSFPENFFSKERMLAEKELLSGTYPDIDMIYGRIQERTNIGIAVLEKWKNMELALEKKLSVPRQRMVDAYQYARKQGKEVYFVSDMYLKKECLEELLNYHGIFGFEDVLVSSQYGVMKTGGLFRILQKWTKGRSCLHIGDNEDADIFSAVDYGFSAFRVPSAREMMAASSYRELFGHADTLGRRNAAGMLAARLFNDPFVLIGRNGVPKVEEDAKVCYCFIAPMITTYMNKLTELSENGGFDGILFLARDGYLLKQLYEESLDGRGSPLTGTYFLTSRFPCRVCGIYTESDILDLVRMGYDGSPEELMEKRFLLSPEEIETYQNQTGLSEYVLLHKEQIFRTAEKLREEYQAYAEKMGIKEGGKYIFTDLAASGTCQAALEKLLKIRGTGFYFVHIDEERGERKLQIRSLFEIDSWFRKDAFICESYVLLENIVTSDMPSVVGFTEGGVPVYGVEFRSEEQLKKLKIRQDAIKEFYKVYQNITPSGWIDAAYADEMLGLMRPERTDITETEIYHEALADDYFHRSYSFAEILV